MKRVRYGQNTGQMQTRDACRRGSGVGCGPISIQQCDALRTLNLSERDIHGGVLPDLYESHCYES